MDGKRTTMQEEGVWKPTICAKHGKINMGGTWLYLPKLVTFLASENKDPNASPYFGKCDKCCKCGKDCDCQH
ncbi:MAG: hypothetical protein AAB378_03245 [Patescibacteria group bacterium]